MNVRCEPFVLSASKHERRETDNQTGNPND
jgi:hypothetical protein